MSEEKNIPQELDDDIVVLEDEDGNVVRFQFLELVTVDVTPYAVLMPLDDDRNYWRLADYFIKETNHHFRDEKKQMKQRYGCTRNLESPVIVRQPARASEFKTIDIKPIKGYQIDEDSIQEYINPITGIPTIYYTMTAIDDIPRCAGRWRGGKKSRIVKDESFSRFEELRQTEFSDLFEWEFL